jgi:hypothetical protein
MTPRLVTEVIRLFPGETVASARERLRREADERAERERLLALAKEEGTKRGWKHPQSKATRRKSRRRRVWEIQGGRPESSRRRH